MKSGLMERFHALPTCLVTTLKKISRGKWSEDKADQFLAAAREVVELWGDSGLDFEELAWDVASEVHLARMIDDEIARLEHASGPFTAKPTRNASWSPHRGPGPCSPRGSSGVSATSVDSPTSPACGRSPAWCRKTISPG
jgi:hypothetical protein